MMVNQKEIFINLTNTNTSNSCLKLKTKEAASTFETASLFNHCNHLDLNNLPDYTIGFSIQGFALSFCSLQFLSVE